MSFPSLPQASLGHTGQPRPQASLPTQPTLLSVAVATAGLGWGMVEGTTGARQDLDLK